MAHAAFININSSLDASPFPSVDQSIKVLPSTFPLVQGLQMLAECILSSSLSNLCPPPPLIYRCVLKSGYFPDIGLWVYFIELSTGGNEYIKNTDINGISQWIQGKQNKLEAQVLKKAFLEMTAGKYGCSKRSWDQTWWMWEERMKGAQAQEGRLSGSDRTP